MAGRKDFEAEAAAIAAEIALGEAGSVYRIDDAAAAMLTRGDPACVPVLLGLLDDAPPLQQAMWSMMHGAESFPAPAYATGLVEALPALDRRAPEWAARLVMRTLNSVLHRPALADRLNASPDDTVAAVRRVLARIAARDPDLFGGKVYEVVSALRDPR